MKIIHAGLGVLLGGLLVASLGAQAKPTAPPAPCLVVGTFDSRAVAIAYIRSDAFADEFRELRAEVTPAEAGDETELQARGRALQERFHRQGFGTLPVDDLLERIEAELPQLAASAGVDVIVSKWCVTYAHAGAEFVDVTDVLAARFEPDEQTLQVIRDVCSTEPVAAERLSDHEH